MKKIVEILSDIVTAIHAAPIKLPVGIQRSIKYALFLLTVLKQILEMQEKDNQKPKKTRYVFG